MKVHSLPREQGGISIAGVACGWSAQCKDAFCVGWIRCWAAPAQVTSVAAIGNCTQLSSVQLVAVSSAQRMIAQSLPALFRADRREAYVGENGLDEAQRAGLMALTPKELPSQASVRAKCCESPRRCRPLEASPACGPAPCKVPILPAMRQAPHVEKQPCGSAGA